MAAGGTLTFSILASGGYHQSLADLADIINRHSVTLHSFADDTQLYVHCCREDITTATTRLKECIMDVGRWMSANRLKLNTDKTELLWTGSRHSISQLDGYVPSIQLGSDTVPACNHVQLLGVIISADLSLDCHVSIVSSASYWLQQLRRVRRSLDDESSAILVHAFVTSRVDYAGSAARHRQTSEEWHRVGWQCLQGQPDSANRCLDAVIFNLIGVRYASIQIWALHCDCWENIKMVSDNVSIAMCICSCYYLIVIFTAGNAVWWRFACVDVTANLDRCSRLCREMSVPGVTEEPSWGIAGPACCCSILKPVAWRVDSSRIVCLCWFTVFYKRSLCYMQPVDMYWQSVFTKLSTFYQFHWSCFKTSNTDLSFWNQIYYSNGYNNSISDALSCYSCSIESPQCPYCHVFEN